MQEYEVIRKFEREIAEFSGSRFAVAVESCTNALFLSCYYAFKEEELRIGRYNHWVHIPRRTYPGVPWSIIHAGGIVSFTDEVWSGVYKLRPYEIYDSAKRFTRDMYIKGSLYCLSFHFKKHIPIGRGGMILCDDEKACEWFRKARFDGRSECPLTEDDFNHIGWNMYMTPEQASRGLQLFHALKNFDDLEEIPDYPDLSKYFIFGVYSQRNYKS